MSENNNPPTICQICSLPTTNSHYGARSCEPCKVFFRRNIFKKIVSSFNHKTHLFVYSDEIDMSFR